MELTTVGSQFADIKVNYRAVQCTFWMVNVVGWQNTRQAMNYVGGNSQPASFVQIQNRFGCRRDKPRLLGVYPWKI